MNTEIKAADFVKVVIFQIDSEGLPQSRKSKEAENTIRKEHHTAKGSIRATKVLFKNNAAARRLAKLRNTFRERMAYLASAKQGSMYLLPTRRWQVGAECCERFKQEYEAELNTFADNYEEHILAEEKELQTLFDRSELPSEDEIREKKIAWKVLLLGDTSAFQELYSDEAFDSSTLVNQLESNFKAVFEESDRQLKDRMVCLAVGNSPETYNSAIVGRIDFYDEQLKQEKKCRLCYNKIIESAQQLITIGSELCMTNNPELSQAANAIQNAIMAVGDPEKLKNHDVRRDFRQEIFAAVQPLIAPQPLSFPSKISQPVLTNSELSMITPESEVILEMPDEESQAYEMDSNITEVEELPLELGTILPIGDQDEEEEELSLDF